jgi:CRISPR-associated protein Csy2
MKRILLIPNIKVQNANAISSPYTIGFPAMTAWLGAVHALERKLKPRGFDELQFKSAAVVCHQIDLQTYKGTDDFVHSIIGTGNPLDKNGNRPSFIEEARCHLTVSLVIEYSGVDQDEMPDLFSAVSHLMHAGLKMAAGDILDFGEPSAFKIDSEKAQRALMRKLMPGHCLIERRELMQEAMADGQDAIDAMLDYLKINHVSEQNEQGEVTWAARRKVPGWIVPIATGFHGISELGKASSQRDPDAEHRFAESVVTLGEFVMPYRIDNLDQMLWHYHADLENNLYLCQQNTSTSSS